MLSRHIIYIIGFMGSGKSTSGKKLAALLGWSFADLDTKIETHAGMSIPEIFSLHGEDYFRKMESESLKSLNPLTNIVVSTGGGTPCFGDNMNYMLETGLTVYLKLTPGQLKSRLADSKSDRPLLKELTEDGMLGFIEEKLALREKWYNLAEITLDGFDPDYNQMCSIVRSHLNI